MAGTRMALDTIWLCVLSRRQRGLGRREHAYCNTLNLCLHLLVVAKQMTYPVFVRGVSFIFLFVFEQQGLAM